MENQNPLENNISGQGSQPAGSAPQPQSVPPQIVPNTTQPTDSVQQQTTTTPASPTPVQPVQAQAAQSAPEGQQTQQAQIVQNPPAPQQTQQTTQQPPQQQTQQGMMQKTAPVRPGQPGQRPNPLQAAATKSGGPNPQKLIFGCLGFIGFSLLLFVVFVIAYVSQTTVGGDNAMAAALGVNPAEFTNTLILLTNLIFGTIVMISFFVAVFGIFRGAMTPKTDKAGRSKGFKQAGIAGAVFLLMTIIWVVVFLYLNGKRIDIPQNTQTEGLVTEPEITTRLTAPVDIKFDATKIPYNANRVEITFYQWDFGDGSSSTSPTVTHTYRDVGQYQAQLTVTARDLTTDETLTQNFSKLVTVIDVAISAEFTMSPESGPAPLTVSFDASDSSSPAGNITDYEWDFTGKNNYRDASGATAEYTFEREGDYEVKLRITDDTGKTAITTREITVGGPDVPQAVIDIPSDSGKYFVGKQLTFLGEKSTSPNGEVDKYEWDFGDGSQKATTRTASHIYKTAGLYEVILKITDETGKTGTSSKKITLEIAESAPQAIIETDPPLGAQDKSLSGQSPFEVSFDASKSTDADNNIVEFNWDFDGDGKNDAVGTTSSYVYKTPGSYNATLTAIDAAGNESSNILVVKVAAQDLTARLVADTVEGNEPLSVTFDASGSSYPDGQITSYEWDFGDGSPKVIGASKISYKYTSIGTFTTKVIAKASDGKTDEAEMVINVRPVALQACFTPSLEQGEAPLTVELDPRCTQGPAAKYLWDFGDGETSRNRKPTHTFDTPGSYQVTLEVTDNQNVISEFSKNILVTGEVQ